MILLRMHVRPSGACLPKIDRQRIDRPNVTEFRGHIVGRWTDVESRARKRHIAGGGV